MSGYIGAVPVPEATQNRTSHTATAGQTSFAVNYTVGFIDVFLNGVKLANEDFTATNTSSVTLAVAASVNDILDTISYTAFNLADTVPASTGGTFAGGVTVSGTLTATDAQVNGKLGVGTTPEAWHSAFNGVLQVGTYGVVAATSGSAQFGSNFYFDGGYKRINTNFASRTYQENGNHVFETAATGDADSAISFSEAMRINSSGTAVFNNGYAAKGNCTVSPDTAGKDTFLFTSNAANDASMFLKSDTTNKINIQANGTSFFNGGAVTMPSQPAFLVHPSSSQDNFGADGNLDVVAFGTERFDQGANFGSNVFTAPVAGKYHFDVKIFLVNLDAAAAYYSVRLVTSNRSYDFEFDPDFGQDAGRWTASFSVLADMAATHTAGVQVLQVQGTSQTDIATQSYFSGHLVA